MDMSNLLSTQDVADLLGVDRKTVLRYLQAGKLRGSRIGKEYRIPEDAVQELLQAGSTNGGKPSGLATVTVLANQKGGVAKTTSSFNLAVGLYRLGNRVLMIDLDPQASLSSSAGIPVAHLQRSIYNVLLGEEVPVEDILQKTEAGPDILPSTIDLAAAEIELVNMMQRELILKEIVDGLRPRYDHIIIDCPPSLGLLTINALAAADQVIIPLQCEFLATRGLALLLQTIEKAKRRLNRSLRIAWILPTMHDGRTVHAGEVYNELRKTFPGQVFEHPIKYTVRLKESPAAGQSIIDYDPESDAAKAYLELAKEVDSRG